LVLVSYGTSTTPELETMRSTMTSRAPLPLLPSNFGLLGEEGRGGLLSPAMTSSELHRL